MNDNYRQIDQEIARVKGMAVSKDDKSSIAPPMQTPLTLVEGKTIDPYSGGHHIKQSTPVKVTYEKKAEKKVKVIFDKDEELSKGEFESNSVMDRDYHTETDFDGVSQITVHKQNGYGIVDPSRK